ncbi:hypothetical protein [Bacillus sp. PS06]|uniref:hypothetical protein n=1 Tax=Bacillus sp. PS06 TaxID=2764176 RepID=UPI001784F941|nr:hypothetical protein [Bacillus sp. PS06]MBD8070595.1 hypothetical protein [Bacillus sp. PS06]
MGQPQWKERGKCPMGVFNGTTSVERESEMSNGSAQWDKLRRKRSRNVQWECTMGQTQWKERVKCPMGVFNGTNSVERDQEMSNGSAQQDKIRRKRE